MAIKSSLVTTRGSSLVKKYALTVNNRVSSSAFALNDKTKVYYNAIIKNYDNIESYFKKIGEEYKNCAEKALNGADLVKAVKNLGKACTNQGTHTGKRKTDLINAFRYAQLENKYTLVLDMLNKAGIK